MTDEELKPCPFCGSLAVVESKEQSTSVRCLDGNCGVSLTRFRFNDSHKDAAFLAWNRRALSPSRPQSTPEVASGDQMEVVAFTSQEQLDKITEYKGVWAVGITTHKEPTGSYTIPLAAIRSLEGK